MLKFFPGAARMLAAVLITGTGTGCEKEELPGHTDRLIGDYTMEAMMVDPGIPVGEEVVTDWLGTLPECSQDGRISFQENRQVLLDQGDMKCDSLSEQTVTAYWVWEDDFSTLTFDGVSYRVLQNDGTTLELSYTTYIPLTDADHTLNLVLRKF